MARMPRVVVPGCPHHVVQRGNRRLAVFLDEHGRSTFLAIMWEVCAKYGVQICAYCLMTNHVHLIAVPSKATSLSQAMHELFGRYAIYLNERHSLIGRLWQGRFRSSAMDEPHFWAAVRYIEQNPVRAGIVARAEQYPWSSAPAHCGLAHDLLLAPLPSTACLIQDWSAWLREQNDPATLRTLRENTRTGRVCGSKEFVQNLEKILQRKLTPSRRGRPRKREMDGKAGRLMD